MAFAEPVEGSVLGSPAQGLGKGKWLEEIGQLVGQAWKGDGVRIWNLDLILTPILISSALHWSF